MNDLCALLASFDHPLKANRMVLRHGGAHDENGIGIAEILLCGGRAAASERCAQTGHGRAMSYTRLIADTDHAQPGRKQFFDQVVFLIVESGAAEVGHGGRLHQ